jgi:enediyne biosynthesis protein E4
MSGGVLLIDYDRDGWPDIYFTNAPTLELALKGEKARSALYHNNRDGTFSDVTDKAGVATPCWAMGEGVGDYNNDGWPDIYVTCLGGNILYRNNGDGTFTDVSANAGVADGRWSMGAAFGDRPCVPYSQSLAQRLIHDEACCVIIFGQRYQTRQERL